MMKEFLDYMETPIGLLVIKASHSHISEIKFWDEEPRSKTNSNDIVKEAEKQLNQYFERQRNTFDLPLNQRGTDFQNEVWSLLKELPYGQTVSYLELSRRVGDVKAIRAVASANGKNPFHIVVPCHRVIGSNGDLTGYVGGLYRKKWLLELEAAIPKTSQTQLQF